MVVVASAFAPADRAPHRRVVYSVGLLCAIDDYGHWIQCQKAIDDYFTGVRGWHPALMVSDYTGRWMQKPTIEKGFETEATELATRLATAARQRRSQPVPSEGKELTNWRNSSLLSRFG